MNPSGPNPPDTPNDAPPNDAPPNDAPPNDAAAVRSGARRGAATQSARQSLITVASSVGAVVLALLICALILWATGKNPITVYQKMISTGLERNKLLEMVQRATPLAISAVAVAIGFKMNLFNIGVEGQYLFGAFVAAVIGAEFSLWAPLNVVVLMMIAMAAAAFWAGIAAVLKVKRGVNEVISTIMLNSIALAVIDWLFNEFFRDDSKSDLNVKTKPLPTSGWMPDVVKGRLSGFVFVALAVVFVYWIVVFRSRFGYRLRASGINASAARTAGINSNRMILTAMLLSGAVAGLIALPSMLGDVHAYGQALPDGLGFAGIAVALLGRNHPAGIVVAALLFGFLDAAATSLQLQKVPSSVVDVIQAVIVLSVVIVNQLVTRWLNKRTADRSATVTTASLQPAGAAA